MAPRRVGRGRGANHGSANGVGSQDGQLAANKVGENNGDGF